MSLQGRVLGLLTSVSAFGVPAGMLVFGPLADVVEMYVCCSWSAADDRSDRCLCDEIRAAKSGR